MRATTFADTFYYLALVNPRDNAHQLASRAGREVRGPIVTTAWVIQEVGDGLAEPQSRGSFLRLFDAIESDPHTVIVGPTATLWRRGIDLYRSRPDKGWSLTDCISFVVMKDRGLTDALTADHHFEQAGFTALLKS